MYAHQVIDDIKKIDTANFPIREKDQQSIVNRIIQSQKFHLWTHDAFAKSMSGLIGKSRAFIDDCKDMIFPYNLCWFDYGHSQAPSIKRGLLVEFDRKDMSFNVMLFMKGAEMQWFVDPMINEVKIGRYHEGSSSNVRRFVFYKPAMFSPDDYTSQFIDNSTCYLALALLFLNCKNIETETNEPPEKLNKKRKKKGKQPLFSYKTLAIKPTSKKQKAQAAQGLWNNRIHLARGHFKTYTGNNPLFGKITGRFWWQPHVRGQNRDGVVMKDYELQTS